MFFFPSPTECQPLTPRDPPGEHGKPRQVLWVLYTKTAPSIVTIRFFPGLTVLIITPHRQTQTKKGHIEQGGMRKMYESFFLSFSSRFPPFSINKHCALCGIIGNKVSLWAHCGLVVMWIALLLWICENCLWCSLVVSPVGRKMWIDAKTLPDRQVHFAVSINGVSCSAIWKGAQIHFFKCTTTFNLKGLAVTVLTRTCLLICGTYWSESEISCLLIWIVLSHD